MINLSIIIPHYNKNVALQETWKELMLQIDPEDRIYIIDDHSDIKPDFDCPCTRTIQPPKVTPHIYRLCTLRNLGIEEAKHDICIILDPDCIPNPNFIKHARKIHDKGTLFGGWINYMNEDGQRMKLDPRSRRYPKSCWVDSDNSGCGLIWGGCMMFSKSRVQLVGLFDEAFNKNWGAEEHEFASRCYHSGMRLRYEKGLLVTHQYHEKIHYGNPEKNRALLAERKIEHEHNINVTYRPAVAVLIVSTLRPYFIDQALRGIFRQTIPIKAKLVNNGDASEEQKVAVKTWKGRAAVEYEYYPDRVNLPLIRNKTMFDYKKRGYKYLILQDDDILVKPNHINRLINVAEANPQYHAISGYIVSEDGYSRQIGGRIVNNRHYYHYPVQPVTREADYISSGFTLIRLDEKIIPFTEDWEMGWSDWDWSMEIKKSGFKVATTGLAGAYHRLLATNSGMKKIDDPPKYVTLRKNRAQHSRMADKYESKWGYKPTNPRPETEIKT